MRRFYKQLYESNIISSVIEAPLLLCSNDSFKKILLLFFEESFWVLDHQLNI